MISCPNFRSRIPRRANSLSFVINPNMLRVAGSESNPRRKSGEERWKKLRACDWIHCASVMRRRSFSAVSGIVTARMSSPAFADVIRWLVGHMPQIREVIPPISHMRRPSQNFSNPRNSFT